LKGADKWYCGKCKNHVVATKKMEIYSAPDYLIVHLKRFSHSRGMWGGRKVGDLITFPVEGLDLTKYILKNSA
jgi:ubiquitin C-terminal hydrolase